MIKNKSLQFANIKKITICKQENTAKKQDFNTAHNKFFKSRGEHNTILKSCGGGHNIILKNCGK